MSKVVKNKKPTKKNTKKISKTQKTKKTTKPKKVVKKPTVNYVKKIINPNTNRYVKLESRLGKSIVARFEKLRVKKKKTAAEQKYVDTILYSKFCKCIKTVLIRESREECPDRKLPYAVCTYNVYNRRGLKAPSNASRGCRRTFGWYK